MKSIMQPSVNRCQDDLGSLSDSDKGNDLSLVAECFRNAIDQTGWKHAAIAELLGVGEQYLARMLSTEKPISGKHIAALPKKTRARYAKLYAEAHGYIVVEQLSESDARDSLAAGLFSMLAQQRSALPAKTSGPVKAELQRRASDRKAAI